MELTTVGTGTVAPSGDRTAAAHWVAADPVRLLLDCGPGVLHRCAQFGIPWHTVTHIAVTHFHVDHWGELPFFLFALRWGIEPAREAPLTLLGPAGFRARMTMLAGAYGDWLVAPDFPLEIVEMGSGGTYALAPNVDLGAWKTPHTDESLAYSIRSSAGRLVYTGDTGYCEELAAWAADCDLMLAECSLPDEHGIDMHLTPARAGALAQAARARRLILTHFYPVFGDADPAAQVTGPFGGSVVAAHDGDRFTLEP